MYFSQGYAEETPMAEIVRAAMFLRSFPDVKSPEQMVFEAQMANIMNDEEIDLDELSPAEFLTESEDEEDMDNIYNILEDLDFLGEVPDKKTKTENPEPETKKRRMDGKSTSTETGQDQPSTSGVTPETSAEDKKKKLQEELDEMSEQDKKAIGALFLSIKQMWKAAKLNLSTLTRIQRLITEYPSLKFLYKLLKPVTEIMPEEPINTLAPVMQYKGLVVTSGGGGGVKYQTQPKTKLKLNPKKYLKSGKVMFRCSAEGCDFNKPSWWAVNTHIVTVHTNKVYMCQMCNKNLTSLDGFCRHMQKQHNVTK